VGARGEHEVEPRAREARREVGADPLEVEQEDVDLAAAGTDRVEDLLDGMQLELGAVRDPVVGHPPATLLDERGVDVHPDHPPRPFRERARHRPVPAAVLEDRPPGQGHRALHPGDEEVPSPGVAVGPVVGLGRAHVPGATVRRPERRAAAAWRTS